MDTNKADKLLKRYLEGTCTAEERQLVESWYDETLMLQKKDPDLSQERLVKTELRERLKDHMHTQKSKRTIYRIRTWSAVAAVLLVFSSYYVYTIRSIESGTNEFVLQPHNDQDTKQDGATLKIAGGETIQLRSDQGIVIDSSSLAYSDGSKVIPGNINGKTLPILELNTPKGGQYQIDLSDGSRVWLNASSSLKFPKEFRGSERLVELTGEAFFEISHDKKKPFKVITNLSLEEGQVIEVLGTKFNVNAYKEDNAIKTTLLEGSVKVKIAADAASQLLKPRQQSIIRAESTVIATKEVNVEHVMAWKKGDFIFDDEDLESIMHKVSRWYDVEVSYEYKPKGLYFKGAISMSRELSVVLQALEETGQVEFKIVGRKIIVKQANNKR
jgi:hypothetical protein